MLRECPSLNWLETVSLWSGYGLVWKGLPCRRKCVNGMGFKLFECPSQDQKLSFFLLPLDLDVVF